MQISVNGQQLGHRTWGSSDNPPLVLMHSTSFGAWMWETVASLLNDAYYVVATDQRGHGDSPPATEDFEIEDLARDLKGALDQLEVHDAVAAGHSSGSTTLLVCESLYPGTFSRLLMIEPILTPDRNLATTPNPMAEQARRRRRLFDSPQAMFDSFRDRQPFATWTDEALHLYSQQGTEPTDAGVALKCDPESEARMYESLMRLDPREHLANIRCPVKLVRGADSDPMRAGMFEFARDMLKAPAEVVPGAGHFIPQEQPSTVARLIREFAAS
ncbi:MAG: alpha/beta hydrolase [Dehalococcoidia bacterium]